MFHIVAEGTCWVARNDGVSLWASKGDVIVLPYGDQHSMGGTEEAVTVPILTLFDPPPWQTLPVLRHGAGGHRTDIVCGYLHSDHPLFNPALRALPPVFVVRPPDGPAARWIQSSIDYALAATSPMTEPDPAATRLPELVLTETLRLHLASAPAIESGWIAALADPVLAPGYGAHARGARPALDRGTARKQSCRLPIPSRRAVPAGARSIADPIPDRLAHAPRRGSAGHDRRIGRLDRRPRRLRLGGIVQPCVQRAHAVSPGAWRQGRLASR